MQEYIVFYVLTAVKLCLPTPDAYNLNVRGNVINNSK